MKIKIICNDPHNPQGTFEFDEKYAKELVKRNPLYGFYDGKKENKEEKIKPVFNNVMTEKRIKEIIEENNIPITYNISKHTKKEIFKKLKELGYEIREEDD